MEGRARRGGKGCRHRMWAVIRQNVSVKSKEIKRAQISANKPTKRISHTKFSTNPKDGRKRGRGKRKQLRSTESTEQDGRPSMSLITVDVADLSIPATRWRPPGTKKQDPSYTVYNKLIIHMKIG